MERADGTICIFPQVIVKQLSNEKDYARELQMHRKLSDTRYFPQLYEFSKDQEDQSCRTLFIENVGDHQHNPNVWSSDYTYYSTFIDNAFRIFEEKRIIPFDLNVCCNIIVNGSEIRIIDFGKYQFELKNDTRRQTEKIRLELLEGVTQEIKQHQDKSRFQRGDRVRARYKGKGKRWYKGTIVRVRDDSTYDIDYDDGDTDQALPVKFIRMMRKK